MPRKSLLAVVCTIALLWCLWTGTAIADESAPISPPSTPTNPSLNRLLELFQGDPKLQRLVEEDLQKSIAIRVQIQEEVDRAFNHTTSLLNTLLVILTSLPVLAGVGIWFIRRSVVNQVVAETKRQVREEVEQQLQAEVKAELKQQTQAFQQEIEKLKAEFAQKLSQLNSDAQKEKDQIIQKLAKLTPSPMRDSATPETQQKIQALTQQLERLQSNTQLAFTANDYVEQGKAFYFEGRYEDAIASHEKALQLEPDNARAWLSQGAAYAKLQQWEAAIAAYETTIQFKPDLSEAWFGKGIALAKLQQWEAAIAAYETAIQLKPDFLLAWFGRARCHALQGNVAAAVADLQQAIVLNPDKSREALKTDSSFDSLRDNPQFQQLLTA